MILRARCVLTDGSTVLDNGAVRVEDGLIAEVGRFAEIDGGPVTDLGDSLLMPGFVNAHTHLELTHLAGRVPPHGDFVDWVGRLVEALSSDDSHEELAHDAVIEGRAQSLKHGVTTVGDITRLPHITRPVLTAGPLRVVSFGEVIAIGRIRDRLDRRLAAAADTTDESPYLRCGISPHAPYTLEPNGLRACAKRANEAGMRLCMHLAETAEEAEFTLRLAGPLRNHLEKLELWDAVVPRPGLSPIEYAAAAGLLGPRMLLAHVNYATDDDLDRLAASGVHVAYCPRTHQAFGHPPHRFEDMLRRGINVCIGTDSLASNPSLSLLDELRFLRRERPDIPSSVLMEMGTTRGALALGLGSLVGRIAAGMAADLTAVPLEAGGPQDPVDNVLCSEAAPSRTFVSGESV